ncbi:FAD-dependent oxidoreductase [Altererythrobacter salegens]|uniref:FAD-dependent oxidoreductase n=1 Tax=Croceibacterium salegens TaxID=1737568 RepID=A0A6I4SRQ1_9SPHN|nr:FAD-binding oxidoreductase [Croceibacterium salegens]MXO58078.1 FAD-dependent oxidoreductase [Croceibacterium salegens]
MTRHFDIVVVGAGMAGASIAAELAPHASVAILESEAQPGYHATGRSAAFWEECYGGPDVVPLTLTSGPYLRELGLLRDRGALYVGRNEDGAEIDAFMDSFDGSGVTIERFNRTLLEQCVPGIRPGWDHAIREQACADIDVAALHQHYLSRARARDAVVQCSARLERAERSNELWHLALADGSEVRAGVLVDAAGAWADPVARMAGARPLGIQPLRRTVLQLRTAPPPPDDLPLVLDIRGRFYFKPENGRLWLSPHDETPSEPCDAAPEELDVAEAIDRFEDVVDWRVEALEHKWAGLRSFAPDRLPVYGYDPQVSGFFWFAGQGGFGIQTAPAAARLGAQLLLGLPADGMTERLDAALYRPGRFA